MGKGDSSGRPRYLFLRIFVSLALLAILLFWRVEPSKVWSCIKNISLFFFLMTIAMKVADRILISFRWYIILRGKNIEVSFWTILRIDFIANFFGIFLPTSAAGDVVRLYSVSSNISSVTETVSSFAVDRILSTFALLTIALVCLLLPVQKEIPWQVFWFVLILFGVFLFFIFLFFRGTLNRFARKLPPYRFVRWGVEKLEKFHLSFVGFHANRGVLLRALILAYLCQAARFLTFYLACLSIGYQISPVYFFIFIPVGHLVALLPISLGGLGVREIALVPLFSTVGLPEEAAFSMCLLAHAAIVIVALPGGIIYALSGISGKKSRSAVEGNAESKPSGEPGAHSGSKNKIFVGFLLLLTILLFFITREPFRAKVLPWRWYEGYGRMFEEGALIQKRLFNAQDGEEVSIPCNGITIRGRFYPSKKEKPSRGILLLHAGHRMGSDMAVFRLLGQSLSEQGFSVLTPSFAGFGKSDPILPPFLPEKLAGLPYAEAALEYLMNRKEVDPGKVYGMGSSLSGSLVLLMGTRSSPLKGIISVSPLRDMESRTEDAAERENFRKRLMRDRGMSEEIDEETAMEVVRLLMPRNYLSQYQEQGHVPVLLVDGEIELQSERDYLRRFFQEICSPKKYLTLKGSGHYMGILGLNRSHTFILYDAGILSDLMKGIREFCFFSEGEKQ